jgi:YD repeat-containing protein
VLVYNDAGKIVSEVDNQLFAISYTYDDRNRLSLWEQNVQGFPSYNLQTKFFYNSADQDTLQQFFHFNVSTGSYYLWRYARRDFVSQKNYSKIRTYDGATNILIYTEDFQWDSHPNPYLNNPFFLNGPPPSNNMTHYAFTMPGYTPQSVDYTYTYNSNGFPLARKILTDNSTVGQYTYTNCQ